MKGFKRAVVLSLIMMAIFVYSLADSITVLKAYAQEEVADAASFGSCTDEATDEASGAASDAAPNESTAGVSVNNISNVEEAENSAILDTISKVNNYYGTSFYILNGIDTEIPYEIDSYPSSDYSEGISILGAAKSFEEVVGTDLADEPEEGVTYSDNVVSQSLNTLPTTEQIQDVRSDFDPSIHYIQWYVIKNIDYYMHVDGVIRTRLGSENPSEASSEASTESGSESSSNASSEALSEISNEASTSASSEASSESSSAASSASSSEAEEDVEADITIELETILGNPVVPDDGEKHLVGEGFKIKIIDNKEPENLTEKIYDAFGKFLKTNVITVSAADGDGTTFEYKHRQYWISVDAAYAYVTAKDISERGLTIPFIFDGKAIEPENITVGVVDKVTGMISALKSESGVEVKARQAAVDVSEVLTLEAGSTVKNDDGKTLTNDDYKIIDGSLKDGHHISSVVFNGSQTGVGESSNEITSVVILDSQGNDVTSQYVIKCVKGKLMLVEGGSSTSAYTDSADSAGASASSLSMTLSSSASASLTSSADISASLKNDVYVPSKMALSSVPESAVLGARLSATGDESADFSERLAVIMLCLMVCITVLSSNRAKDFFIKKG